MGKNLSFTQKWVKNLSQISRIGKNFQKYYYSINPIPTKGGHFGPGRPKAVSHFHSFMTRVTKIHDFVHLSIPLIPVKLILKKGIQNFNKLKKENLLF